jgi:hypothetical protein
MDNTLVLNPNVAVEDKYLLRSRYLTGFQRYSGSLPDLPEGISETLGGFGCRGKIAFAHSHLEVQEPGVDAGGIGTVQRVQDAVPDVVEGKDVAVDRAGFAGRRVDHELGGPQVEAGEVDLGLWPVLQTEI